MRVPGYGIRAFLFFDVPISQNRCCVSRLAGPDRPPDLGSETHAQGFAKTQARGGTGPADRNPGARQVSPSRVSEGRRGSAFLSSPLSDVENAERRKTYRHAQETRASFPLALKVDPTPERWLLPLAPQEVCFIFLLGVAAPGFLGRHCAVFLSPCGGGRGFSLWSLWEAPRAPHPSDTPTAQR